MKTGGYDPNHPMANYDYAWFNEIKDGKPIINLTKFKYIPKAVGSLKITRLKLNENFDHCALTGVKLVFGSNKKFNKFPYSETPIWWINREHILSRKHHEEFYRSKYLFDSCVLITGRRINSHLGHNIAALKLKLRRILKTVNYEREDYIGSTGNYEIIRNISIELEESLKFEGRYPWQPWTYDDSKQKEICERYLNYHIKWEREFLSNLTLKNRFYAFDNCELPELDIRKL